MYNHLIQILAKQCGLPSIPKTPKEVFDLVSSNTQFQEQMQQLENMGVVKKGEDGNLNVIDQDKVNNIVSSFLFSLLKK